MTGKRKSTDGKHVIAAEELVRIRKKRKVIQRGCWRNEKRKESSDESEEDIISTDDDARLEMFRLYGGKSVMELISGV